MKDIWIDIAGSVSTSKGEDKWLDDFIAWLESRGESFAGFTKEQD